MTLRNVVNPMPQTIPVTNRLGASSVDLSQWTRQTGVYDRHIELVHGVYNRNQVVHSKLEDDWSFFFLSCCIPSTYPFYTTTFVGEITVCLSVFSHFPMVFPCFPTFFPTVFPTFFHFPTFVPHFSTFSHGFPWFPNSQCLHGREAEAGPRPRRATGFGD